MALSHLSLATITAAVLAGAGAASQMQETCMQAGVPQGSSMIQTKSNPMSGVDALLRTMQPPADQVTITNVTSLTKEEPAVAAVPNPNVTITNVTTVAEEFGKDLFGSPLPQDLIAMGESTFGSKANLAALLQKTQVQNISYAGVEMKLAMGKDDDAFDVLGNTARPHNNGEGYGLDTLITPADGTEAAFEQRRQQGSQMVNFVDVGAHLGEVTIAAYKKYPNLVRAVAVEPVPTTAFYLNVNMWLNGVQPLTIEAAKPGVAVIDNVVSDQKDVPMTMCSPQRNNKTSTWDAYAITPGKGCNCAEGGTDKCDRATSTTMEAVFAMFDEEDITLVKMDCQDCEEQALLAVDKLAHRVRRLAVEMTMARPVTSDIACSFNQGKYIRGSCQTKRNPSGQYLMGADFCQKCSASV